MVNLGKVQTGVSYKRIIIAFVIIAIFLVLFIVYSTLSQATITVFPKGAEKKVDLTVNIDSAATGVNFGTKTLPGRLLENTQEGSLDVQVTDQDVPAFAKGVVTLVNKRGSDQPVVQGSHLRAESATNANGDPIYFLTDERVVIPANGRIDVTVTAEARGAESNLPAGKLILDRLHESAWDVVYAENASAFTGGTVRGTIVTQLEIDMAKKNVQGELRDRSIEAINNELSEDERVDAQNVLLEVLEEHVNVEPDQEVDSFTVTMKLKTIAFVYSKKDLLAMAVDALGDLETENEEYHEYVAESFTITPERIDIASGTAQMRVAITGLFNTNVSQRALAKEELVGRTKDEVLAYYTDIENIDRVEVSFWPFWVKSVPVWTNNVNIIVK